MRLPPSVFAGVQLLLFVAHALSASLIKTLACGVALGATLAARFSSMLLLPLIAVLLLLAVRAPAASADSATSRDATTAGAAPADGDLGRRMMGAGAALLALVAVDRAFLAVPPLAYWLDDSNVDRGQSLGQLAVWLAQHPSPTRVRLAYFGSIPPERYGVRAEPLDARELQRTPPRGRYVLSAHVFARLRGALAARGEGWLLGQSPSAVVGHAYYVFDVP